MTASADRSERDTASSSVNSTGLIVAASLNANWLATRLIARGYGVRFASTVGSAIQFLDEDDPDLVLVDDALPDDGAIRLCRTLRDTLEDDRPIVVTSDGPVAETRRAAHLEAGAWESVTILEAGSGAPLQLRLETFIRARRIASRDRRELLTDPGTGLYNRLGLSRRAREIGAQAERERSTLGCVVFQFDLAPDSDLTMASCGRVLQTRGRLSDTLARLGSRQFAVVAPRTDTAGVIRLAERLGNAVRALAVPERSTTIGISAAYNVVATTGQIQLGPLDLVIHAAGSLRDPPGEAEPWLRPSGLPRTGHSA